MNYKGDEPGSCRFSVGQIAGKTITAANLKQLLNDKKTETIRGFKSKAENASMRAWCLRRMKIRSSLSSLILTM